MVTSLAGFEISESPTLSTTPLTPSGSVVTSLAGFAGRRPQLPGGRTGIPAALRYPLAVSRRTPVVCSIRRSGHPSRPNATTCSLFSVLKTLLMPTGDYSACCQCPGPLSLAGFQVTTIGRFWVTAEAETGGGSRNVGSSRANGAGSCRWRGAHTPGSTSSTCPSCSTNANRFRCPDPPLRRVLADAGMALMCHHERWNGSTSGSAQGNLSPASTDV